MSANLKFFRRGTCRPEFFAGPKSAYELAKKQGYTFIRIFTRDDWFTPDKLALSMYRAEKVDLRVLVTHEFMDFQVLELLNDPTRCVEQTAAIAKVVSEFSDARVIFALANELTKFARPTPKLKEFWDAHIPAARQHLPKHTLLLPTYAYNRPFYGQNDHADLPPILANCLVSAHGYWPSKAIRSEEEFPWPWIPKPQLVTIPVTGPWEHVDNNLQPGNVGVSFDRDGLKAWLSRVDPAKVLMDEWGPVFIRDTIGAANYRAEFESVCDELGVMRCLWEGGKK